MQGVTFARMARGRDQMDKTRSLAMIGAATLGVPVVTVAGMGSASADSTISCRTAQWGRTCWHTDNALPDRDGQVHELHLTLDRNTSNPDPVTIRACARIFYFDTSYKDICSAFVTSTQPEETQVVMFGEQFLGPNAAGSNVIELAGLWEDPNAQIIWPFGVALLDFNGGCCGQPKSLIPLLPTR